MSKPVKVKPAPAGFRTFTVRLFEVAPRHLRHKPVTLTPITVRARSEDAARKLAREALHNAGRQLRSLSSSQTPDTFLAYVQPLPTGPTALRSPPQR